MSRVWLPGTAGELVQGWLDGHHVHVSAPINRYTVATYDAGTPPLVTPPDRPKTRAALELLGEYISRTRTRELLAVARGSDALNFQPSTFTVQPANGGRLTLRSQLPVGKGLGSSTADLAAACFAVATGLGIDLSPAEVADLALQVEPTDGSVFPGIVAFDHRDGRFFEALGPAPDGVIVLYDCGGEVDTVGFSRSNHRAALVANEAVVAEALAMARAAITAADLALLGRAATLSAVAHQRILPKPELESILRLGEQTGAAGLGVAHSGTTIGVLYDPARADPFAARRFLEAHLGQPLDLVRLIDGGPRYGEPGGRESADPAVGYH